MFDTVEKYVNANNFAVLELIHCDGITEYAYKRQICRASLFISCGEHTFLFCKLCKMQNFETQFLKLQFKLKKKLTYKIVVE